MPTRDRRCHLWLSPGPERCHLLPMEASSNFWTSEGDKMNCAFNVTDFQSCLDSEVLKLPPRTALSFLNPLATVGKLGVCIDTVRRGCSTQSWAGVPEARSTLRFSWGWSGYSEVDPKGPCGSWRPYHYGLPYRGITPMYNAVKLNFPQSQRPLQKGHGKSTAPDLKQM